MGSAELDEGDGAVLRYEDLGVDSRAVAREVVRRRSERRVRNYYTVEGMGEGELAEFELAREAQGLADEIVLLRRKMKAAVSGPWADAAEKKAAAREMRLTASGVRVLSRALLVQHRAHLRQDHDMIEHLAAMFDWMANITMREDGTIPRWDGGRGWGVEEQIVDNQTDR